MPFRYSFSVRLRKKVAEISLRWLSQRNLENLLKVVLNENGYGITSIDRETQEFVLLLRNNLSHLKSGDVIIDIGANEGAWTSELLKKMPSLAVHCFEPQKLAFQKLLNNLESKRVEMINSAVAGEAGIRELYASQSGSGDATITMNSHTNNWTHAEKVNCVTLDSILASNDDVVGIKIDTEGCEWEILSNSQLLLDSRVAVIQFEFGENTVKSGVSFSDFFTKLTALGFQIYRSTPSRLLRMQNYELWNEIHINTVYFASRNR